MSLYDRIGADYAARRRPDPRIAERIRRALGDGTTVVNVGAGTGNYEPRDRSVVAVEPSATMIAHRPAHAGPAVRAYAEVLPFADASVDAALAILTVHHWSDPERGIGELRRVARHRVVILVWDQDVWESFWLVRDYLPAVGRADRKRAMPISEIASRLEPCEVSPVPIPHDCVDGFHGSYWRRPSAYLDPRVRAGISTYATLEDTERDAGLGRLAGDLRTGAWRDRNRALVEADAWDVGYRLVVATR